MSSINAGTVQQLPKTETIDQLNNVLGAVSSEHLLWISGYCYGLAQTKVSETSSVADSSKQQRIWIIYGSQTGNSKTIAEELGRDLGGDKSNASVKISSMADIQPRQLKNCDTLFAVVSTQGEGEPPEEALAFYETLHSKHAPDLEHLEFAILGLGDSSYEYFCEAGKQLDQRLEALKASRLFPRIDADIDYQQPSSLWVEKIAKHVEKNAQANQSATLERPELKLVPVASVYNKQNPFSAEVLVNQRITANTSNKAVQHLELDLTGSGLTFKPGDSLGIRAHSSQQQAEQIIEAGNFDQHSLIQFNGDEMPLQQVLLQKVETTKLHPKVLKNYAALNPQLAERLSAGGRESLLNYSQQYQIIDLLEEYPVDINAQQLVELLQPRAERLYSIASSAEAYPDEVHLTVATVAYQRNSKARYGTASNHLSNAQIGDPVEIYVQETPHFRLPDNADTDIIMVGPGTGVAPFRSFMQHRQQAADSGKNWLFFGNQHFHSDFLYQLEWQKLLKNGILNRMDVAFSRDQAEKVYVQDRLNENSRELYHWLQTGAHLYVCGDAIGMAKAVETSLLNIISKESAKDIDYAKSYLSDMKQQKRFLKDVY